MADESTNLRSLHFPDPYEWVTKLTDNPVSEVSGVVGPSGASAGKGRGQQLWTFRVCLDVWRRASGRIQTTPLVLLKPMTNEEYNTQKGNFKPFDVVRVQARVAAGPSSGGIDALLERFIGKSGDDHELNRAAEELQKPVTVKTARFGRFTLDRRVNWFQAKTEWCGRQIDLSLPLERGRELEDSIRLAEKVWDSELEWDRRIRHFAVTKLLPLKNNSWLNENESLLNAEEFSRRMKLDSITIHIDGSFEFWFNDGDLFWGHSIRVGANSTDGPTDAGIEG